VDALGLQFRELKLRKDPDCVLCGPHATQRTLIDYDQFCGIGPADPGSTTDMTVEELKAKLDRGDAFVLLDVREPHEVEIAAIPGAVHIPLRQLPEHLDRLDPAEDLVVHCKMGPRSARAVKLLREAGFTRARNLTGGIDAWAERIDPSVPRY
jgi:adenylyltransferase/sulfurtransferase